MIHRTRFLFVLSLIWLCLVFILGAWWGHIALKQATRIAELERIAGYPQITAHKQWAKTQNMLFWESWAFFALLVAITLLLVWWYWRDLRRNRSLQTFFASVTHELKTPLTSIRLQAEAIAQKIQAQPSVQILLERLLEDTNRLESQVEKTLELARVEGGSLLSFEPLSVRGWLCSIAQTYAQRVGGRAIIQLDFTADQPEIQVLCDPFALQIVIRNLIENSIRHSQRDPVEIHLDLEEKSDSVIIKYRDNGKGYSGDPKELGVLFKKGARSQGTGIGLYLAKTLLRKMHGTMDVSQMRGKGFQVCFSLPKDRSGAVHG